MLATVLKSTRATKVTLAIIETYAQVRSMVARIAKAIELLKKPTTTYQEGPSKKGCHTKGTWQRQIE